MFCTFFILHQYNDRLLSQAAEWLVFPFSLHGTHDDDDDDDGDDDDDDDDDDDGDDEFDIPIKFQRMGISHRIID